MKFFKRFLPVFLLFMAVFVGTGADAEASASDENISVIVPVTVGITFNADGSTTSTTFNVFNRSSVGIEITAVNATELNNWELVSKDTVIGMDSKQISYRIDGTQILSGENRISIPVDKLGLHNFDIEISRGAWTYSFDYEEAFLLEFQYEIVSHEYTLTLDGNDYADDMQFTVTAEATAELPTLKHDKYEFMGWADSQGKRYTDSFTMPYKNTTLTAMWKLPTYALFSESDGSMTFVQSEEEIIAGQMHNGKKITTVYSGFDNEAYQYSWEVPWYTDDISQKVYSVVFEDYVFPECTDYWFYEFENCMSFDVRKLQVFRVYSMKYMYFSAGRYGSDSDFVITGMESWDTSQVTCMWSMFEYSGQYAKAYHIGNIGLWDVSNVYDMQSMFSCAGMSALELYIGDLGMWDTSSLEIIMDMFSDMGWNTINLNIGNIGTWDVSHVDMMTSVFHNMGEYSESVYIGNLSQWDVSNVWDFSNTFRYFAANATDFYIGDLSGWNVSNAGMMNYTFDCAGENSETFYLGELSKWNTENVSEMNYMFRDTGKNASWRLDLSSWNVSNVCLYSGFNSGVETKVISPIWAY